MRSGRGVCVQHRLQADAPGSHDKPCGTNVLFLEYISDTANYPPAPEGITIYAIGDIHGRLDLLKNLHQQIDRDKSLCKLKRSVEVYLGDYIDRGPNSAGVVSHLIARAHDAQTIFLRGNHEQFLLDFLAGAECWEQWKDVGAIPSLLSYGMTPALLSRDTPREAIRRALAQSLPEAHARFYGNTEPYLEAGPYLLVHAGLRPGVKLQHQAIGDLLGIRGEFLDYEGDFGRIVVHGHTPVAKADFRPNRINIDTGAFATNLLTCIKIDEQGPHILT
jgi:serine/threonine protein phosphatase 1